MTNTVSTIPILETERLFLRPFELSDASDVQKHAGVFEIADTTLAIPHPYEDGMAEEWISTHKKEFADKKGITFAITLKATGELLGAMSLMGNLTSHRAEIGYWIAKGSWNKGFCTEAAHAVLRYGFNSLNLERIFACHLTRNPASGRVMEKLGMKAEGILRKHIVRWDTAEDLKYYGILRNEWVFRE